MRIPEGKRNANNAYVSVNNVLGIASVDYCLHIYNTILLYICQYLEALFRDIFNIF